MSETTYGQRVAPPPPPPQRKQAWWAFGLSISGLLCCAGAVAGWVLSLKALDRSERDADSTGRQVATVALGIAAATLGVTFLSGAAVLAFDLIGLERNRVVGSPVNADPDLVEVGDLAAGVCISDPGLRGSRPHLRRTPCSRAHDAEVVDVIDVPGERFPGPAAIDRLAAGCDRALADSFGDRIPRDLERLYYYPTAQTWPHPPNRVIVCVVHDPKGPMREPLRELR